MSSFTIQEANKIIEDYKNDENIVCTPVYSNEYTNSLSNESKIVEYFILYNSLRREETILYKNEYGGLTFEDN